MTSFYDMMKYARTGIASPSMTHYDKQKALAMAGGGFPISTITSIPPISFKSDGSALTAWIISGDMTQTGTPTPDAPIQPQECGDFVTTGEHTGQYAVQVTVGGITQTVYLPEPLRKIGDYADTISSTGTVTRRIKKLVLDGTENWIMASDAFYMSSISPDYLRAKNDVTFMCSHYEPFPQTNSLSNVPDSMISFGYTTSNQRFYLRDSSFINTRDFKSFLSAQYSSGTPVTICYVLAAPTTEQVTTPTLTPEKGSNTLSVGTTLQPSDVSITGHIKN